MKFWRILVLSCLVGTPAALVGCGDDPINTVNGGNEDMGRDTDPGRPDTGTPDIANDTPAAGDPRLVLLSEPETEVSLNERVDIRVQYLDGNDEPIPDAFISFEPLGDTAGSTLSSRNSVTDEEGIAVTRIETGSQIVDFQVRISAFQNDVVDPILVTVRVRPKDRSDYILRLTYGGPITLNRAEVYLYDLDTPCSELVEHWEDFPSEDPAFTSFSMVPAVDGTFPDHAFNAPLNVEFTYVVARGEARGPDGRDIGYYVTFGCNDTIPEPEPGSATLIEVDMHNLWPDTAGTYRIQSELNLINAIPDEAEGIVQAIIDVFANPGLGILKLVAIAAYEIGGPEFDPDTGRELEYWEVSPWDSLLEADREGNVVPTSPIGTIVVGVLEGVIEFGLDSTGEFGTTLRAIVDAINDLFTNAQHFTLHGDLVIRNDPDGAGLLGSDNTVRFNQITIEWMGDDRLVDLRTRTVIQATDISAAVVFHPTLDETYALTLSPFDVQLNYGDVLLWLVESVVFPAVFPPDPRTGDPVDSFEDFFDYIIDCAELGDQLDCEGDFAPGGPREDDCIDATAFLGLGGLATSACVSLRDSASAALRNWVSSQVADLGEFFTMATVADDPCAMGFSSTAEEFVVTTLGENRAGRECKWDARVRFSTSDPGEPMEGFFFGERL